MLILSHRGVTGLRFLLSHKEEMTDWEQQQCQSLHALPGNCRCLEANSCYEVLSDLVEGTFRAL